MTEYLTTRELAELLRIKERKVYDLAASGKVPCSRATGRLLFPRAEIEAWIERQRTGTAQNAPTASRPNVILGSHDPLLEWALRESRSGLATYFDGSADGLKRFEAGEGLATGLHLYDADADDWNTPVILGACSRLPAVLIEWARRRRGLIVTPGLEGDIRTIADLAGRTFAARQKEAGAQRLFDHFAAKANLEAASLDATVTARSETDAAIAILDGTADATFGLQSLAEQYRLAFVPLVEERFDLLVDRHAWFEPPMQTLIAFTRTEVFRQHAAAFPGYDMSGLGTVHFNAAA